MHLAFQNAITYPQAGLNKMAAILQATFWKWILFDENFCIMIEISLRCFPEGSISIDNKCSWLGIEQATSHQPNQ